MISFSSHHNQLVYTGYFFCFVRLQYHTWGAFTLSTYFFFFQERIDFIVYMLFCPQGVLGRPGVSLEPADMVRSLHQCRCRCYNKESTGNGSIWDCHTFSNWLFFPRLCLGMHTHLIWAVAQCLSPRIVSVFLYEFTAGCSDCLCGIYNCRKLVVNL